MERKHVKLWSCFGSLLYCYLFHLTETLEIKVNQGEPVVFNLPGVKTCGQYSLLNPSLRPVLIVEGNNATNLIKPYDTRASVIETSQGFTLTLSGATGTDAGEYTVASSSMSLSLPCISESFNLTVIAIAEEYLEPWSVWSFCISQCSTHRRRSRSRKCSLEGRCSGMGSTYQTETCDKAEHCPKWSSWGGWGECSAKCGKGFKIRKRLCLSAKSSLVRSSECRGVSTQSHMCLTVCEVFGTWTEWSEWSNCSQSCGSDVMMEITRTRSRTCSTDGQRLVTQNCTGNRTEEEACKDECTTFGIAENTTKAVFVGVSEAAKEKNITIISVVAGSVCALVILVILIIVLVLKNRVHRRRESVPTLRPADTASNRRKKISKERKSGGPQAVSENESGNVYSEFNSNSCWPSSEFDSTYALDNHGLARPSVATVMETIRDEEGIGDVSDGFDSEFDDAQEVTGRTTVCERKEVIYETSRASCQRRNMEDENVKYSDGRSAQSEEYVVTENECYEPPELWSTDDIRNSFVFDNTSTFRVVSNNNNNNNSNSKRIGNETESMYYEPPVEEDIDDSSKRAEMKRQESEMSAELVYENSEAIRGTISSLKQNQFAQDGAVDDYYEIPENRHATSTSALSSEITETENNKNLTHEKKVPGFTQVNMRNGSIVAIDARFPHLSKEDLDGEHTYVNGNATKDAKDFYVLPKYTYGLGIQEKGKDNEHIYDIPKFS